MASKKFALVLVVLMLTQVLCVGCDMSGIKPIEGMTETEPVEEADPAVMGLGGDVPGGGEVGRAPFLSITANDVAVEVQRPRINDNSIRLWYSYQSEDGLSISRQLELDRSLLSMTVYDERGIGLIGREFKLLSDSAASYRVWSGNKAFVLDAAVIGDSVTLSLSDGSRSTSVSWTDKTWAVEKEDSLVEAIADYAEFALNSHDLETAEYLMANEELLQYLFTQLSEPGDLPMYQRKLCAVASIICAICGYLWGCPPCWIPCVPACGIAAACAIADLFS